MALKKSEGRKYKDKYFTYSSDWFVDNPASPDSIAEALDFDEQHPTHYCQLLNMRQYSSLQLLPFLIPYSLFPSFAKMKIEKKFPHETDHVPLENIKGLRTLPSKESLETMLEEIRKSLSETPLFFITRVGTFWKKTIDDALFIWFAFADSKEVRSEVNWIKDLIDHRR